MQLRKRGGIYHVRYIVDGVRVERSTRCTDRKAAEAKGREWERDAADPDHAAQDAATMNDALALLLGTREGQVSAGKRAQGTLDFYRSKAGHVARLLGDLRLKRLRAGHVDGFIATRRTEGAAESTIYKELVALRSALKLAKRGAIWRGDPADVCPVAFAPAYVPRTRVLTLEEVQLLIAALPDDRGAQVAFMVGTGAEWSTVARAERVDVTDGGSRVLVRGTKRATRWRVVPVVSAVSRQLLAHAVQHGEGRNGKLFTRWPNVRRDLHHACAKIGCVRARCDRPRHDCKRAECIALRLAPCSPNDLRRTFGNWLRVSGAATDIVGASLGHIDSRMAERVYGQLSTDDLEKRLAFDLRLAPPVPHEQAISVEPVDVPQSENALSTSESVPRDGIEPPTRGFSIPVPLFVSSGKSRRIVDDDDICAPRVPRKVAQTEPRRRGGRRE